MSRLSGGRGHFLFGGDGKDLTVAEFASIQNSLNACEFSYETREFVPQFAFRLNLEQCFYCKHRNGNRLGFVLAIDPNGFGFVFLHTKIRLG